MGLHTLLTTLFQTLDKTGMSKLPLLLARMLLLIMASTGLHSLKESLLIHQQETTSFQTSVLIMKLSIAKQVLLPPKVSLTTSSRSQRTKSQPVLVFLQLPRMLNLTVMLSPLSTTRKLPLKPLDKNGPSNGN